MTKYSVLVDENDIIGLVTRLVKEGCWFEVEPLPGGLWNVSVKADNDTRVIGFRRSDVG